MYKFMSYDFETQGVRVRINRDDVLAADIVNWYKAAGTAEYIMDNPETYRVTSEEDAYRLAKHARALMEAYGLGEDEAVEQTVHAAPLPIESKCDMI